MYAFSKFFAYGQGNLTGKIEDAITGNLGKIGELKDRIAKLENDNVETAK